MSEYNSSFADVLFSCATDLENQGIGNVDAQRAILYLCLLASEVRLKAILEKANLPILDISKASHDFKKILMLFHKIEFEKEITPGVKKWFPGSEIRAITIDPNYSNATVGNVLDAEGQGASKYPSELRYGDKVRHYDTIILIGTYKAIAEFSCNNWANFRIR